MLEPLQRTMLPNGRAPMAATSFSDQALLAGWRTGLAIVNLRGNPEDPAFRTAVSRALKLELPVQPCSSVADKLHRIVWVGPDDWFVIGPRGQAGAIETQLRAELAGLHHAVTDVSGGYTVLHMSGRPVREVLAQGCPLDLHPRSFKPDSSAGSVFFKASIWLWQTDEAPTYEVLVRSSFMGYFWLMLERCTQECGLVTRRFL
jgi:sarcosine oxidase, subunit gamma